MHAAALVSAHPFAPLGVGPRPTRSWTALGTVLVLVASLLIAVQGVSEQPPWAGSTLSDQAGVEVAASAGRPGADTFGQAAALDHRAAAPAFAERPLVLAPSAASAGVAAGEVSVRSGGLEGRFTPDGAELTGVGGPVLTLSTTAVGAAELSGPAADMQGETVVYEHEGITEWFVPVETGFEHGYTIAAPVHEGAELRIAVDVGGATPLLVGDNVVSLTRPDGSVLFYRDLYAFDATGRDLASSMTVEGASVVLVVDTRDAVYPVTIDPLITEDQKVLPVPHAAGDRLGGAVDVDRTVPGGPRAVVAASNDDQLGPDFGAVNVYRLPTAPGAVWSNEAQLRPAAQTGDIDFGFSVALAGDRVAVGAPGGNGDEGQVHVFERITGFWTETQVLASPGLSGGRFGASVALNQSGTVLVVGAPDSGSGGQAWAFLRDGGAFTSPEELVPASVTGLEDFGAAVAITDLFDALNEQLVIVGDPGHDQLTPDVGVAVAFGMFESEGPSLFSTEGGNWMGTVSGEALGASVAIDIDATFLPVAVLGAPGSSSAQVVTVGADSLVVGAADNGLLTFAEADAAFGASVDFDGATIAVGAPLADGASTDEGVVMTWPWDAQGELVVDDFTLTGDFDILPLEVNENAAGNVAIAPGSLVLTDGGSQASSVFLDPNLAEEPSIRITESSFATRFDFALAPITGAGADASGDGFTFIISGDPAALGGLGASLGCCTFPGYVATPPISPSLAVEFDTYPEPFAADPNGNHVGINVNGSLDSVAAAVFPTPLDSGAVLSAWIDYDALTDTVDVFVSTTGTKPGAPTVSAGGIDLDALVGPVGYFGFTSATAAAAAVHEILTWDLSVTPSNTFSFPPAAPGDEFGAAVAVGGDELVAGGPGRPTFSLPRTSPAAGEAALIGLARGDIIAGRPDLANELDAFGFAVDVDGNRMVASAIDDDESASRAGVVYVFERAAAGDPWAVQSVISSPLPENAGRFGDSIGLNGDWLVVGQSGRLGAPNAGEVFLFFFDGASWTLEETFEAGDVSGAATDEFGASVAVNATGDQVAIGAPGTSSERGAAYLVDFDGESWTYTDLDPDDPIEGGSRLSIGDRYGQSLAFGDGILAVGSPGDDTANADGGAVYVWSLSGVSYLLVADNDDFLTGDRVGQAIAVDGSTIAAGGVGTGLLGDPYTLHAIQDISDPVEPGGPNWQSVWGYRNSLPVAVTFMPNDWLDVSGDTIASGLPGSGGEVLIFANVVTTDPIAPTDQLQPSARETGDRIGFAVALDGDSLAAGAWGDDDGGTDAGAVYAVEVEAAPPSVTVSYSLPPTTPAGASTVPFDNAPIATIIGEGGTPDGDDAASDVSATGLADIDLDETDATGEPSSAFGAVTLGELGLDTLGEAAALLFDVPLTELTIDGGWGPILAGTAFEFTPLQNITLGDVYGLAAVQSTPLRFTDIQDSPLRFTDISAAAFGTQAVGTIDLDGDGSSSVAEWCSEVDLQGLTCGTDISIDADTTVGALAAAGVDVEATPLRFTPLRFTYIEASPLRFTPLRFTDIQGTPLRFTPLRFTPLRFTPLRFTPLRFTPLRFTDLSVTPLRFTPLRFTPLRFTPLRFTPLRFTAVAETPLRFTLLADIPTLPAVVDCSLTDCAAPGATLEDAAADQALLDFPLDALGDAILGQLLLDDILAGLDDDSKQAVLDALLLATLEDFFAEPGASVALGDLTLGDIDQEAYEEIVELFNATVEQLFADWADSDFDTRGVTFGDFLLLFMPRESYEWDAVNLADLRIQAASSDPGPVAASVDFTVENLGAAATATVTVDLPSGASVEADTVTIAPAGAAIDSVDTSVDGVLAVVVSGVSSGVPHTLGFDLGAGLVLGASDTSATVEVATLVDTAPSVLSVGESFEPNDTASTATLITDDALYISHIGSPGDVDLYALTVPTPLSDVSIRLSNLAVDLDLKVYGPSLAPINEPSGQTKSAVPDPDSDITPGNDGVAPAPLSDLPSDLSGSVTYGLSYNRGTEAEQVDFTALLGGPTNTYIIEVSGYLGAASSQPYSLQAAIFETTPLPCPARSLSGGLVGSGDAIGADTNTLILLNEQRLGHLYGPAVAADIAASVDTLVASVNANTSDGVEAAVVAVDADPGVRAAYAAADGDPCNVALTNAVVGAIADLVHASPADQIDYVVVVGNDDVIPYGRVKDPATIANEQSYATTFGATENNSFRQAFAGKWLLTDTPYGDPAPDQIENSDRLLYVPELSVGRLVETPTDIVGAIDGYLDLGGVLTIDSAFAAGYDFLDDGAEATADEFDAVIAPNATDRLINETWTRAELADGLDNGGDAPDMALVAAHFDHFRALPAAGNQSGDESDLFEIGDILTTDYSGSLVASVGCHSGLNVPNELIAPTGVEAGDWAERLATQGAAVYAANTGFGYGDDAAVAYSEELARVFADGLDEYQTAGQAHLYAMQEYASDLTALSIFDEKVVMEWALYGLPFYRLGNPVAAPAVESPPIINTPSGLSATVDAQDPFIFVGDGDTPPPPGGTVDALYYTEGVDGERQTQVTSGYPILPRYEFEVTQQVEGDPRALALEAQGVFLESLTTVDDTGIDPATARAVVDLAANEPATDSASVTFFLQPTVNTFLSSAGTRQKVSMTVGAFETTSSDGSGTMRRFEQFDTTVYYAADTSPGADRSKPRFRVVDSQVVGEVLSLSTRLVDESAIVRVAALATPNPAPGVETDWELFELSDPDGDGRWTGSVDILDPDQDRAQWILMAVDANGNVGWSVSKFLAFQGQSLPEPPPASTLSVDLNGAAPVELYQGAVSIDANDADGQPIEVSVDGGEFVPHVAPLVVSSEGYHTVIVRTPDGQSVLAQFRIDISPPDAVIRSPLQNAELPLGGGVPVLFGCADAGSPVTCTATLDGAPVITGAPADDGLGERTLTVTADDGISSTAATVTYTVVAAPELGEILAPIEPVQLGDEVAFSVDLTDLDGDGDAWTVVWDFGDGTSCSTDIAGDCSLVPPTDAATTGSALATRTYAEPGVYTVTATVTDSFGLSDTAEFRSVVIFDPEGGFATGGGWFIPGGPNSDPGDVLPGLDGTSKANFGFVVKFRRRSTEPQGNFTFHYNVGDFRLKSVSFDWLVVNPSRAQFQGLAEIRGLDGLWPYRVVADDRRNGPDRFRVSIWAPGGDPDAHGLVYRASGELGGGQIRINTR